MNGMKKIVVAVAMCSIAPLTGVIVTTVSAQARCLTYDCSVYVHDGSREGRTAARREAKTRQKQIAKARAKTKALNRLKKRKFNQRIQGLKKANEFNRNSRSRLQRRSIRSSRFSNIRYRTLRSRNGGRAFRKSYRTIRIRSHRIRRAFANQRIRSYRRMNRSSYNRRNTFRTRSFVPRNRFSGVRNYRSQMRFRNSFRNRSYSSGNFRNRGFSGSRSSRSGFSRGRGSRR